MTIRAGANVVVLGALDQCLLGANRSLGLHGDERKS